MFCVKNIGLLCLPFALLGASSIAAEDAGSTVLQPLGKWQVDYGNDECRLVRSFGEPANPVAFQLAQFDPTDGIATSVSIVSKDFKQGAASLNIATSVQGQDKSEVMTGVVLSPSRNAPPILYIGGAGVFSDLIRADMDAGRSTIASFDGRNVHLKIALGKMNGPIQALNACMDDLLRSWGLDPEQQHSLRSKVTAVTSPGTWFSPDDYPAGLRANMRTGGVTVRLNISAKGEITECHVMQAGGDKSFEDLTCELARKNGRFNPAIASDGKPIASYTGITVFWKMF